MANLRQRKATATDADGLHAEQEDGKQPRSFEELKKEQQQAEYQRDWIDELGDVIFRYDRTTTLVAFILTVLSFGLRFWDIGAAKFVVWDEAHFGKFASYYLRREFYFDVHPPLGKMLVAFGGLMAGYTGDFDFESGKDYPENLRYGVMRMFLASFGSMLVPLAYLTMYELGFRQRTRILAATMILCESSLFTISRYILLDSMLLYFTAQTLFCMAVFRNHDRVSFTFGWWFWLVATGVSIGCVSSVKWIGFFVTALVGLYTIEDLWNKLGDLKMPIRTYINHWLARIFGLILIPFIVYVLTFQLHFAILSRSGTGDAQMSSLFQAQLDGNQLYKSPIDVAFGSNVTLKNNGYAGGLLHSHVQTFPHGSKQQQVTCYHHRDSNNNWSIQKVREEQTEESDATGILFLKDGDVIRLVHVETQRNLHSHPISAPVTKSDNEVSGYGNSSFVGDSNDYWRVEIVNDVNHGHIDHVKTLTTRFRLRHVNLKCLLRSHNVHLPQWGFKQSEVTCDKQNRTDNNNIWNVEEQWNPNLPPGSKGAYKTSFWADFIHINVAMWSSNNALTPDPDKEPDQLTSTPAQWPLCTVGLRMCGWGDDKHKVFLLGNPIVWWSGFASLLIYCALTFVYLTRQRRGIIDFPPGKWDLYLFYGKLFGIGWLLHYVPFMIMARVTYLHHYFPAVYFVALMSAFIIEHISLTTSRYSKLFGWALYAIMYVAVIGSFIFFFPLSRGFNGPSREYKNRQLLSTWNVYNP